MSIIIIGAGEMGYHLARRLSFEKRDVTVIDSRLDRVDWVQENLDVRVLHGRGSSPSVLRNAGIESASIMVAVTDSDEVNLVACYVAGMLNKFMTKVARLRQEEYSVFPEILDTKHLGIDLVISPETEAVKKLLAVMEVPAATDVIDFAEGRIKLFGIQMHHDSPLLGHSLMDLRAHYPDQRVLIPAIFRDSGVIIPRGKDTLNARDTVYFMAAKESIPSVIAMSGHHQRPLKNFMIHGGTAVAVTTARELEKRRIGEIRLVHSDANRCEAIAAELDNTLVLRADEVDEEFLRSEGISEIDAFLALSEHEEKNALNAILAKRMGALRVAALTNRMEYQRLASAIGLDIAINPRLAGASRILQYIRKGKVISVSMLPGEGVEAIEYEAMETSALVGKPLRRISFPHGAIVGAVERDRAFFIPHGNTVIQPGDRVIIFTQTAAISKVERLLTVSLEYF